ncbi:ketopantoate reductase family protein [Cohnella caldifontis]|uniref:ketopantoate reductase family protein n=1 Tax=Cohnella caldifontis TaxID=3027471 RepID=UPI0023EB1DE1|nr:2-dehydropantoate 2-reductase [Cohnella sp. YIM B05605]
MDRTVVMGGGALGMLLAGKLAAAGIPVRMWTRTREQALVVGERGIELEEGAERVKRVVRLEAAAFEEAAPAETDLVLVAIKQTAASDRTLRELDLKTGAGSAIVLFQNGIGHAERFAEALPGRRILVAVTTEGALRTGVASVRHTGSGTTWIGEWGDGSDEEAVARSAAEPRRAADLLEKAGFSAFVSNSIRERMLRKLLINAVINPLTALWRVPNGELPATPDRMAVMEALFRETLGILRKHGLKDGGERELWASVLEVCRATAANRSSMLQDVLAGRDTEIGALNGALCELAASVGMKAPWNAAVAALVKAI